MVGAYGQVSAFAAYSAKSGTTESRKNIKKNKRKRISVNNKVIGRISIMRQKPIKFVNKKEVSNTNKLKLIKKTVPSTLVLKHNIVNKKPVPLDVTNKVLNKKRNIKRNKNKQRKRRKSVVSKKTSTNQDDCPIAKLVQNVGSSNYDPKAEARQLFGWLIHPLNTDEFFKAHWEKTPLHVKRHESQYYQLLMTTPMLDQILRNYYILFTKNIDITSYSNGIRETHNPDGRAMPSIVWDYYLNGCSVRMLNPQSFIPKLHTLNATLQEFFGCFVGANSYLTPPNSQGFAPHYDDIEAFVLQIEGKKRWRLYNPKSNNECLPRFSSQNLDSSEIGEPIFDKILSAGDLLYFPRGTIHQGETVDDEHSLHITLSVFQRNSWGDLMENIMPHALQKAIDNDQQFRMGLPFDYLDYMGYVHSTAMQNKNSREAFSDNVQELFLRILEHIDVDKAADSMAQRHIHDFLPPVLTESEQECSVAQDGERITKPGTVEYRVEIDPGTKIRLVRSHCIRLVEESDTFKMYYSTENSTEYHEYEPQYLEIASEFVPAVREIILRYPKYIRVEDLPINGEDNKIQIAKDLWEKCIVVTDHPLGLIDE